MARPKPLPFRQPGLRGCRRSSESDSSEGRQPLVGPAHAKAKNLFIGLASQDQSVDALPKRSPAIILTPGIVFWPIDRSIRPRDEAIDGRGDIDPGGWPLQLLPFSRRCLPARRLGLSEKDDREPRHPARLSRHRLRIPTRLRAPGALVQRSRDQTSLHPLHQRRAIHPRIHARALRARGQAPPLRSLMVLAPPQQPRSAYRKLPRSRGDGESTSQISRR